MVEKRLHGKLGLLREDSVPPTLYGSENYSVLVVVWGSNYHVVREAIDGLGRSCVSMLHFSQVYPLSLITREYLDKADTVAIVENNATCQLGNLIQLETGFRIHEENRLLKYDGLPFPVEQVAAFLEGLGGGA
jgi:2-oxoglutarate ferredoxin oxidoreductase subunit alpha